MTFSILKWLGILESSPELVEEEWIEIDKEGKEQVEVESSVNTVESVRVPGCDSMREVFTRVGLMQALRVCSV